MKANYFIQNQTMAIYATFLSPDFSHIREEEFYRRKENLINQINRSGWKFNSKSNFKYEEQNINTLEEILSIMKIATTEKVFSPKPHSSFKKVVTHLLGIPGRNHIDWKKKSIQGMMAARLYDQLVYIHKKNRELTGQASSIMSAVSALPSNNGLQSIKDHLEKVDFP